MELQITKDLGIYIFANDKCRITISYEAPASGIHIEVHNSDTWEIKKYQTYTTTPSAIKKLQERILNYLQKNNIQNEFNYVAAKSHEQAEKEYKEGIERVEREMAELKELRSRNASEAEITAYFQRIIDENAQRIHKEREEQLARIREYMKVN